jgi:hypothetical protein
VPTPKLANQQNEMEKTPDDSLVERIKEHVRDRGPALRTVFKIPVPFVRRIETLSRFIWRQAG